MSDARKELERIADAADAMALQSSAIAELAAGLKRDGVLSSELVTLQQDPTQPTGWGSRTKFSAVPHSSVAMFNMGTMTVTATTGGAAASLPGEGPGVAKIPAGGMVCIPFAGTEVTFYGRAGEQVGLVRYSQPQPPAAAHFYDAPWHPVVISGLIISTPVVQYTAPWNEKAIYGGITAQDGTGPAGTGDVTEIEVLDPAAVVVTSLDTIALAGTESVGEELPVGRLCTGAQISVLLVKGSLQRATLMVR